MSSVDLLADVENLILTQVSVSVADLHQQIQHKSQKRPDCRLIPSRDQSPISPTLQVITRIFWRRKKAHSGAASVSALPVDWCVNRGQRGCLFMSIRSSISEQTQLQTPFIPLQQPPHLHYPAPSFNSSPVAASFQVLHYATFKPEEFK